MTASVLELTDEQVILKNQLDRFLANHYKPAQRGTYRSAHCAYDTDNWKQLAGLGLLALSVPTELGGLGGGASDIAIMAEAFGQGLVAEPCLSDALLGIALFAKIAPAPIRAAGLQPLLAGERRIVLVHAEPTCRFELHSVRTQTVFVAGREYISGRKTFVLAPRGADEYLVTARPSGGDSVKLYLVAPNAAGLQRRDFQLMDGSVASEIVFENVEPTARLDGGIQDVLDAIRQYRLATSAELLGVADMLFTRTVDYVRERKQFGQPIGRFQAIQHSLADLYARLEQSRSQVIRAVAAWGSDQCVAAVAGAKSYVSSAALEIAEAAVQLHGAMGVTDDLIIGHGLKRVLVLSMAYGDADAELMRYAISSEARFPEFGTPGADDSGAHCKS